MNFNPNQNSENKIPNTEQFEFKRATGEGNFLKMYQDPTVLGFKLFFVNISDSTPSVEGNVISNDTNIINSTGLFGNADNQNSALYYLNSMGDSARFKMLENFKRLMSELNTNYPWYFQSLEGLGDAWSRDFIVPKFKKEITIQCLESIDLRITALMDLYRKIAYDWQNRRVILPDNLRKFDLSIKVFDQRKFQRDPGKYITSNEKTESKARSNEELLGSDWSVTNQVTFNLSHCEFLPDESGNMFSSISNNTYEQASQSIKIQYENIDEDNIYRSLIALGNTSHYYVRDYLKKELDFINGGASNDNNKPNGVVDAGHPNYDTIPPNENLNDSNYTIGNIYGKSPNDNETNQGDLNEQNKIGGGDDNVFADKPKNTNDIGNNQGGLDKSNEIGGGDDNVFGEKPSNAPNDRKLKIDGLKNRAKQELGNLLEDIEKNVSAQARNLIENKLNSLYLGNVYGFSASTLKETARNSVVNAPSNLLGNTFGN